MLWPIETTMTGAAPDAPTPAKTHTEAPLSTALNELAARFCPGVAGVTMACMQVVTAAIIERDGSILLARRGPNEPLAGRWEFPGGKLEDGETPEACLARELREELAVTAAIGTLFAESTYDYGSGQLRLLAFHAAITEGVPKLSVHSELAWVDARSLLLFDLLPADVPIANKLAERHAV